MSFPDSHDIELGNWLNDEGDVLFPEALPTDLKALYDTAFGYEKKFEQIFNRLGKQAVAHAMRLANDAKKRNM